MLYATYVLLSSMCVCVCVCVFWVFMPLEVFSRICVFSLCTFVFVRVCACARTRLFVWQYRWCSDLYVRLRNLLMSLLAWQSVNTRCYTERKIEIWRGTVNTAQEQICFREGSGAALYHRSLTLTASYLCHRGKDCVLISWNGDKVHLKLKTLGVMIKENIHSGCWRFSEYTSALLWVVLLYY